MQRTTNYLLAAILVCGLMMVGCERLDMPPQTAAMASSARAATQPATGQPKIVFDFDGTQQGDGLPTPWKSRVIKGSLGIAIVNAPELNGHHALQINCQKSHFIVYDESSPFDPRQFPVLSWSWKATELPIHGDVRTHDNFYYSSSNRNDKVLQVLVGFEGDRVINYSWDTSAPIGTCVEEWSPVAKIKTYIVESGSQHLGIWQEVKVNILADYQKLYGSAPGKVLGISVQTNSNHTGSCSAGLVGPIQASTARM